MSHLYNINIFQEFSEAWSSEMWCCKKLLGIKYCNPWPHCRGATLTYKHTTQHRIIYNTVFLCCLSICMSFIIILPGCLYPETGSYLSFIFLLLIRCSSIVCLQSVPYLFIVCLLSAWCLSVVCLSASQPYSVWLSVASCPISAILSKPNVTQLNSKQL